jgi:uncharacterized membrane protein
VAWSAPEIRIGLGIIKSLNNAQIKKKKLRGLWLVANSYSHFFFSFSFIFLFLLYFNFNLHFQWEKKVDLKLTMSNINLDF